MQRPVQRRPPTSTASRTRSGVRAKNDDTGSPATPDTIARRRQTIISRHRRRPRCPNAHCHTWDEEAMWNGRDPKKEITFDGARFGSIEHWADGIITRGVMLDVPRHRGVPCVTHERPVHGWELDDILTKRGIRLEPGD